jgi:hypothetical protein
LNKNGNEEKFNKISIKELAKQITKPKKQQNSEVKTKMGPQIEPSAFYSWQGYPSTKHKLDLDLYHPKP